MIAARPGEPRQGRRGRGRGPAGDRRGVPQGQPRHHRLLQPAEHPGRHRDAVRDRRHGQLPPRAAPAADRRPPLPRSMTDSPGDDRTTSCGLDSLYQFIVPLTFLAIWALTSLFNREAQPLPPEDRSAARTERPSAAGPDAVFARPAPDVDPAGPGSQGPAPAAGEPARRRHPDHRIGAPGLVRPAGSRGGPTSSKRGGKPRSAGLTPPHRWSR